MVWWFHHTWKYSLNLKDLNILPVPQGVCPSQEPVHEAEGGVVQAEHDWVDQVSQSYWPRADTKVE